MGRGGRAGQFRRGGAGAPGCRRRRRRAARFHRYHSTELVTDLRCGQLPDGMLDRIDGLRAGPGDQLHVVLDDDGPQACRRHDPPAARQPGRRRLPEAVQRVGERCGGCP